MSKRINPMNARRIRRGITLGRETARHYQNAVDSVDDPNEDPKVVALLLNIARKCQRMNVNEAMSSGSLTFAAYTHHSYRWGFMTDWRSRP